MKKSVKTTQANALLQLLVATDIISHPFESEKERRDCYLIALTQVLCSWHHNKKISTTDFELCLANLGEYIDEFVLVGKKSINKNYLKDMIDRAEKFKTKAA